MDQGVEIDSEARKNEVATEVGLFNHCVVIMEQPPMTLDAPSPRWRVSATLTLRDVVLGQKELEADLPVVLLPPVVHKRQVVALAKYPSIVVRWSFRFESDDGRARARVWLHPGTSSPGECGIFVVPHIAYPPTYG